MEKLVGQVRAEALHSDTNDDADMRNARLLETRCTFVLMDVSL